MLYSLSDFTAVIPELILSAFAIIVLFVDLWLPKNSKGLNGILSLLGITIAFISVIAMFGAKQSAFNNMVVMDASSNFINIVILLVAFLTVLMSFGFLKREDRNTGEYYVVLLFSLVAMEVFGSTYNLVMMFVAVETLSISMYILTGFLKNKSESVEGAMKYFILGSFASSFIVLGLALVYGMFHTVDLNAIHTALIGADKFHVYVSMLAFLLILIGLGFKIAAFPFHAWTPDVYAAAPTPISAFMSIAPKAASFLALIRVLVVGMGPIEIEWTKVLWVIAVLTMTFGNTVALWQKDLKRLLGYSSIAHAGYMLVGITAANELGYGAVMFYLFGYVFMNIGAFAVAEFISRKEDRGTEIANLRGMAYQYPLVGASMLIFMFSLAGVPSTVGFIGKFYLFSAAVKSHLYWLAVIGVVNSAISAYFYLSVVVTMYMKGEPEQKPVRFSTVPLKTAIFVGALGTLFFGIFPSNILNIALHAAGF